MTGVAAAAGSGGTGQTPYIGSKISLISKLDIRYEGILYTVDTNDSTIALAKVRSYGTEDRKCAKPVAARDDVYEYIIFKAADIKELVVTDTPKTAGIGLHADPAIVSASARHVPVSPSHPSAALTPPQQLMQRLSHPPNQMPPMQDFGAFNRTPPDDNRGAPGFIRSSIHPGNNRGGFRGINNLPGSLHGGNRGFMPRGGNQMGGFRGNHRGFSFQQQHHGGFNRSSQLNGLNGMGMARPNPKGEKLKFDGDFDFEKANQKFKEEIIGKMEEMKLSGGDSEKEEKSTAPHDPNKPFYDKKNSFFDRISCEAIEKAKGNTGKPDWKKEWQTNQETFGSSAQMDVRSMAFYRGRGRGRGFGARGFGRGGFQRGAYRGGPRPSVAQVHFHRRARMSRAFAKKDEITQVLQSGRMKRLFTTSSQLFRQELDQWKELTAKPIFVHIFHDQLEDVTKMLALDDNHYLIINNVPLSSNFTISSPSSCFVHFVSNKFDKNCDVYGFGFKEPADMERFYNKLSEIRSSAIASLTPTFHSPGLLLR
ncbi:hypothetical protein WR25_01736 isoform A [Diploscapter pachys]|uniref:FFD box profile domain-containing protein n=1 Tax=Diploscapter pachys TaxID=2018661 RepID=A0A2A2LRS5_9BILA|nr:hypothetical protein WR25_01736 isoform A [Diploscapter pachys]